MFGTTLHQRIVTIVLQRVHLAIDSSTSLTEGTYVTSGTEEVSEGVVFESWGIVFFTTFTGLNSIGDGLPSREPTGNAGHSKNTKGINPRVEHSNRYFTVTR